MSAWGFRILVQLFLFWLTFSIEVRVRAENLKLPVAQEALMQPENCWSKNEGACAVHVGAGRKYVLILTGGGTLTMDQSTAIIRMSETEFRLVAGQVWIQTGAKITFASEFGKVVAEPASEGHAELWLRREGAERIEVSAVRGLVQMLPRGSSDQLEVAPGLENWIGRVGDNGRARSGVPIAISLKAHIERWARLYPGTRGKFAEEVQAFAETWQEATGLAAEVHKQTFERRVASLRSEHERKEEIRKKVQARDRELVELFRKKVLEP